jgi:signal transduction histidine kinase
LKAPANEVIGASSKPAKVSLARSWRHRSPPLIRYAIAAFLVLVAWAVTFTLRTSVHAPTFQTPFFVCAIVLSSWIGGFGPGILASVLSIFALEYCLTPPLFTHRMSFSEVPKFVVFFFTGAFISWLARRQRRDEEALLRAREGLEEKVRERTADLQLAYEKLTAEVAERARAEKELHRINRVWRMRSICNRAITRSADESELLKRVCQTIIQAGGYRLAWVRYAQADSVVPAAHAGHSSIADLKSAWAPGGCGEELSRTVIRDGKPRPCNWRLGKSEHLLSNEWADANEIKAVLGLLLIADGGPIGSLLVYSNEWEAFDEKETELLQQAANDIAQGIVLLRARIARLGAEEALKKTEAELTRVARVTTMGELTASIAHEINQPLAALVTNANACLRWLAAETPNLDEARTTAQRIVRDGKRASEVIARVRALLAQGQPMRQRLNLNDVILEILPLLQTELLRRETKLETEFARGLPAVEIDRVQIQQLLMNLVVNSLDAMDCVTDRPHVLRICTSANKSEAVLVSVQDSGMGLSPEQIDRLFDAFYSTKADGMGMGLSISRSIAEAHGGRLWAESNGGHGATFRFTLPTAEGG